MNDFIDRYKHSLSYVIKYECGKIIKFKTVTELLDVSIKTLQRWDAQGKIKVVRTPSGRRRIPESKVHRILGVENIKQIKISYLWSCFFKRTKQKGDLERQISFCSRKNGKITFFFYCNLFGCRFRFER